ncbi:MAG TPA: hypothetical protein VFW40_03115, partial [Capsulimonadaceae bacterium]|nr:hypothetical protein [Capsulimonadaceae bacterium]
MLDPSLEALQELVRENEELRAQAKQLSAIKESRTWVLAVRIQGLIAKLVPLRARAAMGLKSAEAETARAKASSANPALPLFNLSPETAPPVDNPGYKRIQAIIERTAIAKNTGPAVHCYTSIGNNYLPKARVLARSLKRFNPNWVLHVFVAEPLDVSIDPSSEPFGSIVTIDQLGIPNLKSWIFKHNVMEIGTAIKGRAAQYLIETHSLDKVFYFDPDIAVFGDLSPLANLVESHPILLAPHATRPVSTASGIKEIELLFMRFGAFNLGFLGLSAEGQGAEFLQWWSDRLDRYAFIDLSDGLFTDQRWCDLAPIYFDQTHILRDPQYDVAYWNLTHRKMCASSDGPILIDDHPLGFFHFSGYDSGVGRKAIQSIIPDRKHVVYDLLDWYGV